MQAGSPHVSTEVRLWANGGGSKSAWSIGRDRNERPMPSMSCASGSRGCLLPGLWNAHTCSRTSGRFDQVLYSLQHSPSSGGSVLSNLRANMPAAKYDGGLLCGTAWKPGEPTARLCVPAHSHIGSTPERKVQHPGAW